MTTNATSTTTKEGFALLITLIIVTVVLAIGLSLIDIVVKQLSLSSNARESELAFAAANAAVECAQAERISEEMDIADIADIPTFLDVECFGTVNPATVNASTPAADVYRYSYSRTWNAGPQMVCSQFDLYLLDATDGDVDYTFTDQGIDEKECTEGDVCTVIFARGFNRACADTSSLRTVQRELTIDF